MSISMKSTKREMYSEIERLRAEVDRLRHQPAAAPPAKNYAVSGTPPSVIAAYEMMDAPRPTFENWLFTQRMVIRVSLTCKRVTIRNFGHPEWAERILRIWYGPDITTCSGNGVSTAVIEL